MFAPNPYAMCAIVTYYKLGGNWYLDLSGYLEKEGACEEDLERIGSFADFLELAAEGRSSLQFEITDKVSEDADILQLSGSAGDDSGAYYHLEQFRGQPVDIELWFNRVLYHFVDTPPERLYIRQIF
jgi:hypothetical protein